MEPSHDLIDRVVHQYEENCIKLIELHKCTSREQEIKGEKSSPQLSFDSQGNIKVSKQSAVADCPINGEIKLRAAFTRRSLAYDLANVASFQVMEAWSQLRFDRVCQEPPAGYRHIAIDQIVEADRKLWVKISEHTRSKVTGVSATGVKNVDAAIQELQHHPDVQFYMLPLPLREGPSSPTGGVRSEPYQHPPDPKGKGKGKKGGKDPGKGRIQVPDGCSIKFGENKNKPICMKFNVGAVRGAFTAIMFAGETIATDRFHTMSAPMLGASDKVQEVFHLAMQYFWNFVLGQVTCHRPCVRLDSQFTALIMSITVINPRLH